MVKTFFTLLLFVFVSVIFTSCSPKDNSNGKFNNPNTKVPLDRDALPVITFENDFHDFGKINSGEKITYAFKFKNTGKSVLIVSNVSTSCGCTISSYPKQPVKPGEESTIDVSFDSTGKHGLQNKSITVYTNADPPTTTLRIQSLIVESEDN